MPGQAPLSGQESKVKSGGGPPGGLGRLCGDLELLRGDFGCAVGFEPDEEE
jgi:hypothetical protein